MMSEPPPARGRKARETDPGPRRGWGLVVQPAPDVLVHLRVAPAEAVRRMEQRPRRLTRRLDHLGVDQVTHLVDGAAAGLERVVERLETRDTTTVVI